MSGKWCVLHESGQTGPDFPAIWLVCLHRLWLVQTIQTLLTLDFHNLHSTIHIIALAEQSDSPHSQVKVDWEKIWVTICAFSWCVRISNSLCGTFQIKKILLASWSARRCTWNFWKNRILKKKDFIFKKRKKIRFKKSIDFWKKNSNLFIPMLIVTPRIPKGSGFPYKISANLVQPFGQL